MVLARPSKSPHYTCYSLSREEMCKRKCARSRANLIEENMAYGANIRTDNLGPSRFHEGIDNRDNWQNKKGYGFRIPEAEVVGRVA